VIEIIYLHGFASSPQSNKAQFFRRKFEQHGITAAIPDLDERDFEHLTITKQLQVIERTAGGRPVTLIGSSMGGYLAALYAARHPEAERFVLLAPAFGFARRWPEYLGGAAVENWRDTGWRTVFHYGEGRERQLSYSLIEDAGQYEDFPNARQPGLILQGTRDEVVPARLAVDFAGLRPNVRLVLLDSGHELTGVTSRLWAETAVFLGIEGA
jgi:pimeloyl-ACP methyl ester carboxylesterase